jgi:bacillithiol synthase
VHICRRNGRARFDYDDLLYHEWSMHSAPVSYARAPKMTSLFLDYMGHFDRVQRFYRGYPQELRSYVEVARGVRSRERDRGALVDILERQNLAFGCSDQTLTNIRRLGDPETLAVVTGQQAGLFSGPAFTLYKALTAIATAQHLEAQGLPCVPVFWLATEDHDLEEVAHAAVLNEAGELVMLSDRGDRPAPQSSVGYVRLSPEINDTLDHLERLLPAGAPRGVLMHDLRESYAPGSAWGEAFGRLLTRVFGRFGVVLIDPLDNMVHHLAQPAYEHAFRQADMLRKGLQKRSRELVEAGYHAQVHVGDDSTLLFAAASGNRTAVKQHGSQFYVDGADPLSISDIEAWIARRPVDFSPSALLRPVLQDTLLPTVAYVAGPSELAYFAQSEVLYPHFGRPMPVVVPRAGFTLAGHHVARLLQKYGLALEDVWQGKEHLSRRIAASLKADGDDPLTFERTANGGDFETPEAALGSHSPTLPIPSAGANNPGKTESWSRRLEEAETHVKVCLEGLREDVKSIDPTLLDAIRTGEDKVMYQLDRLRGKISRAAVERSELLKRHEQDLLRFLMPAGNLQEREVSGVYFLAGAGYELLDRLLAAIPKSPAGHQLLFY